MTRYRLDITVCGRQARRERSGRFALYAGRRCLRESALPPELAGQLHVVGKVFDGLTLCQGDGLEMRVDFCRDGPQEAGHGDEARAAITSLLTMLARRSFAQAMRRAPRSGLPTGPFRAAPRRRLRR